MSRLLGKCVDFYRFSLGVRIWHGFLTDSNVLVVVQCSNGCAAVQG